MSTLHYLKKFETLRLGKILYEKGDRIAHITLNRPETLNAVDDELDQALWQAWADFNADDALRIETLNAYSSVGDFSEVNPIVAKAGGDQSQGAKGEAVVIYCEPLVKKDLGASGFPGRVKK